ncbi:helix-turn-helix transcriptional regulator [uncultured Christiangramia sp.]|uniref:helix-turn-helix domain-containing protein n=1 Tax=Christiangramia sp. 3-2217-3z TaxID=3417564 RepID=UPI00260311C7|nr:helix-turn-helix transcriptional regulator [uncultured Christiangramia sp.]
MAELSKDDINLANLIAQRIKFLRERSCGKKQADFVKKYNIEKQFISRWESKIKIDPKTGKKLGRGITIYSIQTFCNAIGITLKEFFDDDSFNSN